MSLISARWVSIFQSTLSVRRATPIFDETYRAKLFQSTLSVRRATNLLRKNFDGTRFQSTLSVRRATHSLGRHSHFLTISIHALRKESDQERPWLYGAYGISIHALRKESDILREFLIARHFDFNPRSP